MVPLEELKVEELVNVEYSSLVNLLKLFKDITYNNDSHTIDHDQVENIVANMWSMDYACMEIPNVDGAICPHYPRRLIVPYTNMMTSTRQVDVKPLSVKDKRYIKSAGYAPRHSDAYYDLLAECDGEAAEMSMSAEKYAITSRHGEVDHSVDLEFEGLGEFNYDGPERHQRLHAHLDDVALKLKKMFEDSMFGRSRCRIVFPCILYKNRYVTRSSTLPLAWEIYGRMGLKEKSDQIKKGGPWSYDYFDIPSLGSILDFAKSAATATVKSVKVAWNAVEKAKKADVALLLKLRSTAIFDLMVEKGKVKYYLTCSSSEKQDGETLYKDFNINQVPYPGCEFFTEFKRRGHHAEKLYFDWETPVVDSTVLLTSQLRDIQSDWTYQIWPLSHLTKVYLMAMLKHLLISADGLLVHCISGWDRTPLFISLLRISLWADGEIHQSLTPLQMLYFTVAYDWMLFGHNLKDRRYKGEEIMFFCFYFLKYIKGEEFNMTSKKFGILRDFSFDGIMEFDEDGDGGSDGGGGDGGGGDFVMVNEIRKAPATATKPVSVNAEEKQLASKVEAQSLEEDNDKEDDKEVKSPMSSAGRAYSATCLNPDVDEVTKDLLNRTGGSSPPDAALMMEEQQSTLDDSSPVSSTSRKDFIRYKRLTELRKLWFDSFKNAIICDKDPKLVLDSTSYGNLYGLYQHYEDEHLASTRRKRSGGPGVPKKTLF